MCLDLTDPQSLLAYAYANNNSASLSDPNGTCALMEGESSCSGGRTKTQPSTPSSHHDAPVSTSNSNSDGSSGNSSNYDTDDDLWTPPARPHPDRMFEIAGCYGGPGCVMPEGFSGMYGPYRYKPFEKEFGDILVGGLFFDLPMEILVAGRLIGAARSAMLASRAGVQQVSLRKRRVG
ncbi:hypothetical protein F1D05_36860 [Kribbella qitaiheensis]|uniref:Uncharacterized protein n=1 Tax=Kribbella qitaiheensis TaxID=1544730 RepID=A0A7G6X892_9ACTN|nr:hypothetical protein [Kribbella qitaiheensis]QNE22457.1 hypothetical protein F1D05_36860 [Kribbella qitaiheensis]